MQYELQFGTKLILVSCKQALRYPPQVAFALTNQDGTSSIKVYESEKSYGKIGDCEQSNQIPYAMPSHPTPPSIEQTENETSACKRRQCSYE